MSAISEKIRTALYAKLAVSTVLSSGTGYATAIYYHHAPNDATLPYVVYDRVAPGTVKRPVLGGLILEDDIWQIKAITDFATTPTGIEPVRLGQAILSACETAINETLTVSGNTVEYIKRVSDIPGFKELVNDRWIYHEGFNLRTQTS